jgi:hypothetical protein
MPSAPEKVVLHPLVLLSVVDHYNRVAKDTKKRVVGVLLGETSKGVVDVSNSFAVPFEEDDHDPTIWFLDHSYLEQMYKMFKKVNGETASASTAMCLQRRQQRRGPSGRRAPRQLTALPALALAPQLASTSWAGTARGQSCANQTWISTS